MLLGPALYWSGGSAARSQSAAASVPTRPGFLGAFFRPQGTTPFGVFRSKTATSAAQPSPTSRVNQCSSSTERYVVDPAKLANIADLGVAWTRMPAAQFFEDGSHTFGPGPYTFTELDAAECSTLVEHGIRPVIGLEAGPVQYNATPGQFSPQTAAQYRTAADFGQWCGVVAAHERTTFPSVQRFSLPGNEVNSNPELFPGGEKQIAAYSKACYAAIKSANPAAFVYGFELNMDGNLNPAAFVRRLFALGCKVGTCYDGLAIHLSLDYPVPPANTPCHPNPGGRYSLQCVRDIEDAAQAPIHVLVGETVYTVPGSVPNEAVKALAIVAELTAFAADRSIDGVSYANVDECAIYPTGYFSGGCLVDASGKRLPAFTALQTLAGRYFR
jgi:hypothetical protein